MKTGKRLFVLLMLISFSCETSSEKVQAPANTITAELNSTNTSLSYLLNDSFKSRWLPETDNHVFYLILRECSCVSENIDFIVSNIDQLKASSHFLIKNPDNSERWKRLRQTLIMEQASFAVDSTGLFESRGFVYASDKVFSITTNNEVSIEEFKIENHSTFLNL